MAKDITARDMFSAIKSEAFQDIDTESVTAMTEVEQQQFMLEQADRLLSDDGSKAAWIADLFWHSEDNERIMNASNPLFNPEEREGMTEAERSLCAFYITLSGICCDLYHHLPFDPMVLGIHGAEDDLMISNKPLVAWLEATPYIHIAVHVAYAMKLYAWSLMYEVGYQPAKDHVGHLWNEEYKCIIASPDKNKVPAADYVRIILDALQAVDKHLEKGMRMGLTTEEIFIHDEIFGRFVTRFDTSVVQCARELNEYLRYQYERQSWMMRIPDTPLKRQPKPMQRQMKEFIAGFVSKVQQVREDNFGKGWMEDDSLAMGYLTRHAELKANGIFE